MRLWRIDIEQFRSVEDQWIPAEGLVVLFGMNSAGKTSLLEAVEGVIAQTASFRPDPGASDDPIVLGSVLFSLPAADVTGSDDARLYLSLLRGDFSESGIFGERPQYPWDWLDDQHRESLKDLDLHQAKTMLTDSLVASGNAGTAEDRKKLASSVFDPASIYLAADRINVSFNIFGPYLPVEARKAARRIAGEPGEDPLWKLACALTSDGWAHVAWVASGSFSWPEFAAKFPPVIALDGDIESLSGELEGAIVSVHNRLWAFDPTIASPEGGIGRIVVAEPSAIGSNDQDSRYRADQWLETQSKDGSPIRPGIFAPYNEGDWYRVRHSVLAAAILIETEANRIAPDFVKNQGRIGVEVLPVSVWGSGKHRVRATFTDDGDETRDLKVVGAGTARWAGAAIRLAMRRLSQGQQIVVDENGAATDNEDERRRLVSEALRSPLVQTLVRLEPSDAPAVYIADEPESHLHPAALRSVGAWLGQLAESAAMVLVATHSTALLDCRTEVLHRVLVRHTDEGTQLQLMAGDLADELGRISEEFGLTKGELLLMTRLVLFVEGQHDVIVLHEWFADELRTAGVLVFPVHGVDNMPGLATSEIIAALGIRIATLSDDTSVPNAIANSPRTRGERAVARLIAEAERAGITIHAVGLDQPDILFYLDETICRQHAPGFPGWRKAIDEWAKSGEHAPWKRWVKTRYSLPLTPSGIMGLAQECRVQGKIPTEIVRKVQELIAYAAA